MKRHATWPRAQNVPIAIIEKIQSADIFVADITSVTRDQNLGKSFPNPNVVFELGYAAAHLGWARIIMLFNKAIAEFDDLPFDFDRQRMSPYTLGPGAKKPAALKPLSDLAYDALDIIATEKPRRPRELEGKTDREMNVEMYSTLRRILARVNSSLLDQHLHQMPEHMFYSAAYTADALEEHSNPME